MVPEINQKCFICGKPWKKDQESCYYCGGKNKVANFKSEKDMEQFSSLKILLNSLKVEPESEKSE
ncbi:hypothetical protein [Methanobacterium alcaliphilum]|uniref:hypothetical protein n=1 Tax=Methanobacterium alcaliphilum TaxID=392018 RepID=UPI00200A08E5|nr:hypothetical protein [Methanobacterium alcaliphilum]MCK9151574.1 hypothetical protein [Methanobacterium alcaliphilum]